MDRATRRHYMARTKRRVRYYYGGSMLGHADEARCIGQAAETPHPCSNVCCGNPRRHFGKKTRAEQLHEQTYKDMKEG